MLLNMLVNIVEGWGVRDRVVGDVAFELFVPNLSVGPIPARN